jgi:hypothetical protein
MNADRFKAVVDSLTKLAPARTPAPAADTAVKR